ncbi:hypothetical protein GNZ12_38935 [Paraburkholderia sp. 1N]|uniref:Uncharacterized protein n=1 Tax=Paraburkholderia solitsugae TaxID=2675748 RepID=A0ABX2C2A6_9BURK|nr:hypothetical protein [Paraburkholderia solitsugae]NPT47167.1 hypothetical protein [Paraburkholderia solitsugae]
MIDIIGITDLPQWRMFAAILEDTTIPDSQAIQDLRIRGASADSASIIQRAEVLVEASVVVQTN